MPCDRCGNRLILTSGETLCPDCSGLKLIDGNLAAGIAGSLLIQFNQVLDAELKKFDRKGLIVWLLGWRERAASDLFDGKSMLNLHEFLSANILIKRVMTGEDYRGEREADEKSTDEIVKTLAALVDLASDYFHIRSGFATYRDSGNSDISHSSIAQLVSRLRIVYFEEWQPILKTFETNMLMPQDKARKEVERFGTLTEYSEQPRNSMAYDPEQFMRRHFDLVLTVFNGLLKNRVFAEVFNFDYLVSAGISPIMIWEIAQLMSPPELNEHLGLINVLDWDVFCNRLQQADLSEEVIARNLVFSSTNADIFPVFVRLRDKVVISRFTNLLLFIFLHPLFYKAEFDRISEEQGHDFERGEVVQELKANGFDCIVNVTDRKRATLQIDVIAHDRSGVFVIECKNWTIRPFYEQNRVRDYLVRDLKGIVDGYEYTTRNAQLIPKRIPSLLQKLSWVKENASQIGIPIHLPIIGMIVTRVSPPIQEHRGIRILPIFDIAKLRGQR